MPKPRTKRVIKYSLFFVVSVAFLSILFLPNMLTSTLYSQRLTNYVFESWKTEVDVEEYELGWFNPLVLHDIRAEFEGEPIIEIEKAETELPLTRLFTTGDNYRKVTLHSMKARIQQFESVTNIEMVSGVDEQMIMDIEILDADVTMENANGFQWADIKDVQLMIRISQTESGQKTTIEPANLIDHGPIQLSREDHIPVEMRKWLKDEYIEAIVSLDLVEYSKLSGQPNSLKYKFRLVIHELKLEKGFVSSMANAYLKQMPTDPESGEKGVFLVQFENGKESIVPVK